MNLYRPDLLAEAVFDFDLSILILMIRIEMKMMVYLQRLGLIFNLFFKDNQDLNIFLRKEDDSLFAKAFFFNLYRRDDEDDGLFAEAGVL